MKKYYLDEYEPIQQQMIESVREISLSDEEVNELLRLIDITRNYICKAMIKNYYTEVEFLDGLKSWVSYDAHVSNKQMIKFWSLHELIPESIESGLL